MAAVTTEQLLSELQQACYRSALVDYVETHVIDADILSARIHLARAETFISVFYNISTDKTAFALVESGQRVYGVDNARRGWHEHPFHHPTQPNDTPEGRFLASGNCLARIWRAKLWAGVSSCRARTVARLTDNESHWPLSAGILPDHNDNTAIWYNYGCRVCGRRRSA
jgi:hypothetical protein